MEIDSNAIDLSANDYDDIEDVSITPAKSAYMYFSGEYFPIAQAMLANEGFGDWVKEVSKKVVTLKINDTRTVEKHVRC